MCLQGTLAFPAVLERLHLPAFELCKVLEPFVQQVPSLPRRVGGAMRTSAGLGGLVLASLAFPGRAWGQLDAWLHGSCSTQMHLALPGQPTCRPRREAVTPELCIYLVSPASVPPPCSPQGPEAPPAVC